MLIYFSRENERSTLTKQFTKKSDMTDMIHTQPLKYSSCPDLRYRCDNTIRTNFKQVVKCSFRDHQIDCTWNIHHWQQLWIKFKLTERVTSSYAIIFNFLVWIWPCYIFIHSAMFLLLWIFSGKTVGRLLLVWVYERGSILLVS